LHTVLLAEPENAQDANEAMRMSSSPSHCIVLANSRLLGYTGSLKVFLAKVCLVIKKNMAMLIQYTPDGKGGSVSAVQINIIPSS